MSDSYDFGKVLGDFFQKNGYTEMKEEVNNTNTFVPPKSGSVNVSEYNELINDYKNLSARSKKELSEAKDAAVIDFVADIADSIIDLSKCTDVASKLVYENLIKALRKHGIVMMNIKVGSAFDTERMHAVSLAGGVSPLDCSGDCIVSRVYSDGFYNEQTMKVVKPAMVEVMNGVE